MRLFIGIEIPSEIKAYLAQAFAPIQATLKGWENPHDYHLTLLFMGEVPVDEVSQIEACLQQIQFSPFNIITNQLAFFNRRVLYLSFQASPELIALKQQVENLFPQYVKEGGKPFIPHLTVKRWQRYEYDDLEQRIQNNPLVSKSIRVEKISLFKSEKDELNRKYHVLSA